MSINLNGWRRLWVVSACVYFVVIAAFVVLTFPRPTNTTHSAQLLQRLPAESRELLVLEDEHGWTPVAEIGIRTYASNGALLPFKAGASEAQIEKARKDYEEVLIAATNVRRWSLVANAAISWLVPCAAIYILGWSVGWIRRGFRSVS